MLLEEWSFRGRLHGEVNREVEKATDLICSGGCTPDEYKFLAGRIAALKDIINISKQIVAVQEDRDNAET